MAGSESDPMLLRIMESLGALRADMQNMKDDQAIERQTGAEFRREVREEIATVKNGVSDVQHAIRPVAEKVERHNHDLEQHSKELAANKVFRDRIGAVIAVGATGVSTVFGGVIWLIAYYWAELMTAIRGLFTRS